MVRGQYKGDIEESEKNDLGHNRSTGEEGKAEHEVQVWRGAKLEESRGATSEGRQHTAGH